jgi:uncharacterized protein YutE (UPF0331/DUF86 family)
VLEIEIISSRRAEDVLKEAIDKGNYFEAVVLSATYLEAHAIDRVGNYLASKGIRQRPFLYRMNLSRASQILGELRLIDQKTRSMMRKVNKYRNTVIHDFKIPEAVKPDDAKRTVEKTLECLDEIALSYESMTKVKNSSTR